MNKTPFYCFLAALLLSSLPAPAAAYSPMPAGDTYIPAAAQQEKRPAAEGCGHLLPAMQDYLYCLNLDLHMDVGTYRRAAFDIARRFPQEVNDLLRRRDGSWATPLSLAVQAQDAELVELLLRKGAHPFTPHASVPLAELAPLPRVKPDPRINELLHEALVKVNPLQLLAERDGAERQARLERAERNQAQGNKKQVTRVRDLVPELPDPDMIAYGGVEPGNEEDLPLYRAYMMLFGTVLQVQPLSCTELPPERCGGGGLYSKAILKGRIVRAIKGNTPEQEFITWSTQHEGRLEENTREFPADAEPMFLTTLGEAKAEGDTLDLGHIDPFDMWTGKRWERAFERVLADFPELRHLKGASKAELGAAARAMQAAQVVVRAEIFCHSVKLDEQAGTATVTYWARLRDPLKGGIIKGVLKDWSNIEYTRSFPLTEEWRRIHDECAKGLRGGHSHPHVPVVLMLAETPEGEAGSSWTRPEGRRQHLKVQQAFDAMSDAAMLNAVNDAAFSPDAEIEL